MDMPASPADPLVNFQEIHSLLQAAGMAVRLTKFFFMLQSVDFFIHVIYLAKLPVANRTVDAIAGMKTPHPVSHRRSFVGMCNVYHHFVPNLAQTTGPLTKMLQNGEPVRCGTLNERAEATFSFLKLELSSSPILALPRNGFPYVLDTDSCDRQVYFVLMKVKDEIFCGPWAIRAALCAIQSVSTTLHSANVCTS